MVLYDSLCIYWKWPRPLRRFQVVSILAAAFLIHLSLGSIYTYGNMVPYLVSYVRKLSGPSDIRNTDVIYVFSCQLGGLGFAMTFGGLLEKRFGPRLVTLFGGWLMSLGVLLSYLAIQKSFWILLITYGVMFGIGIGLAYIGPIVCAIRWLPKWKGIVSGIVVSGFGLSALIFNAVQTGYINPNNKEPDEIPNIDKPDERYFTDPDLLNRIPNIFLILGGTFAIMQLVGAIFLVNPLPPLDNSENHPILSSDQSHDQRKDSSSLSYSVRKSSITAAERNDVALHIITPLRLLIKPNFYILWIMFFCLGTSFSFITTLYKSFGLEEVTRDDHFLTIAGSVSSFFNLLGRLLWGALADCTTYKFAFVIQGALMTCLVATFYATSAAGKVMFFFWICGIFFVGSGSYALFPTAVAQSFGLDYMSINYGLLFTSQTVGGIMAAVISQTLVDHIDWYGTFFVLAGLNVVEYILVIFYYHKKYSSLPKLK